MTITNGTIEFTRRLRTGDFEHKDAKVSLSFTVPEGMGFRDDAASSVGVQDLIAKVAREAVEHALHMVGEKTAPQRVAAVVTDEHQAVAEKVNEPHPHPMADIMGNGVAENPPVEVLVPTEDGTTARSLDPIPDKRLLEEIQVRNSYLLNAAGDDSTKRELATQKIVKLVTEYSKLPPGPGRTTKILQDQRAAFLKALAELT